MDKLPKELMNKQTKNNWVEKQTHKCIKLGRVSIKMSTLLIVLFYILASKNQFINVLCVYSHDIPLTMGDRNNDFEYPMLRRWDIANIKDFTKFQILVTSNFF